MTAFSIALTTWYQNNKRDLPWRKNTEPYSVWVSEIMCQQTQVATVIPYYNRWLETFPTIEALANAEESEVLMLWQGLGYYRRAKNFHKAAKQVLESGMPTTAAQWKKLAGIGDYTSAAIASISTGEACPAIDGNAERVCTRILNDSRDPKRDARPALRDFLQTQLDDTESAGDFNQAIMELGATICRPKSPDCSSCPVQHFCVAFSENTVETLPFKPKKKKPTKIDVPTLVLQCQRTQRVLIEQRNTGLLNGLWGFVMGFEPHPLIDTYFDAAQSVGTVKHLFTHRDATLHVRSLHIDSNEIDGTWVAQTELDEFPISTAAQKTITLFSSSPFAQS